MTASPVFAVPPVDAYALLELIGGCGWRLTITAAGEGELEITAIRDETVVSKRCESVAAGARELLEALTAA